MVEFMCLAVPMLHDKLVLGNNHRTRGEKLKPDLSKKSHVEISSRGISNQYTDFLYIGDQFYILFIQSGTSSESATI